MRKSVLCALLVLGLFSMFGLAAAQASPLEDARNQIAARQYDRAIATLEKVVSAGKANAEVYNELGKAYHWKKDFDNALKNYRIAAKLDKKYLTSALPILDGQQQYDEIIQIGEAAVAHGDKSPTTLTALLNAYFAIKDTKEYDRVLGIVKAQRYSGNYDANYRLYILAKAEMRANQPEAAIAHIEEMDDRALLQYMRTVREFQPLTKDERFIKKTR